MRYTRSQRSRRRTGRLGRRGINERPVTWTCAGGCCPGVRWRCAPLPTKRVDAALASAQCLVAIVRPHRVPIGREPAGVVEADVDIGVLLWAVMAEASLRDSPVRFSNPRVGESCQLDRWLVGNHGPDVRVQSAAAHGELLDYLGQAGSIGYYGELSASDQSMGAPCGSALW